MGCCIYRGAPIRLHAHSILSSDSIVRVEFTPALESRIRRARGFRFGLRFRPPSCGCVSCSADGVTKNLKRPPHKADHQSSPLCFVSSDPSPMVCAIIPEPRSMTTPTEHALVYFANALLCRLRRGARCCRCTRRHRASSSSPRRRKNAAVKASPPVPLPGRSRGDVGPAQGQAHPERWDAGPTSPAPGLAKSFFSEPQHDLNSHNFFESGPGWFWDQAPHTMSLCLFDLTSVNVVEDVYNEIWNHLHINSLFCSFTGNVTMPALN
jgi:hypothetical protein